MRGTPSSTGPGWRSIRVSRTSGKSTSSRRSCWTNFGRRASRYRRATWLDLLALPAGTRLQLGAQAVIEVTGLRNPCRQLDAFQAGLMRALLDRAADGSLIRKAGIMGVVVAGGEVRPGDPLRVTLPPGPHRPLEPV